MLECGTVVPFSLRSVYRPLAFRMGALFARAALRAPRGTLSLHLLIRPGLCRGVYIVFRRYVRRGRRAYPVLEYVARTPRAVTKTGRVRFLWNDGGPRPANSKAPPKRRTPKIGAFRILSRPPWEIVAGSGRRDSNRGYPEQQCFDRTCDRARDEAAPAASPSRLPLSSLFPKMLIGSREH